MGVSLRCGVDDGGEGGRRPPWAVWVLLHLRFRVCCRRDSEEGGREKIVGQRAFYQRERNGERERPRHGPRISAKLTGYLAR